MALEEYKIGGLDGDFKSQMRDLVREDALNSESAKRKSALTPDTEVAKRYTSGSGLSGDPAAAEVVDGSQALIEEGSAFDMQRILAEQMGMDFVNLDDYPPTDYKVLRMLSADQAKQYRVFPLEFDPDTDTMTLAISDPSDPTVVDDLSLALGCTIHAVVANEEHVSDRISQSYGVGDETLDTLLDEFSEDSEDDVLGGDGTGGVVDISDMDVSVHNAAPIVALTNLILIRAIKENSSDIHIEPFDNLLRIRYRVDGMLREMQSPPVEMQIGLISRLKVMANMDIAETRRPQDGRIRLNLPGNNEIELRVTSAATVHGESIVMRVLDKTIMQMGVGQIGMTQDVLTDFLKQLKKPNGIVLVTGPTGCGKTTTLYAAMNEIKDPEEKMITTEDPVEYQVDGIVQVNINEAVGLTYSRCLRAILRQDPDRILVGEIRDLETARISVESALTGHMVFSTLHTNSSAGTITRLIDMGVEPFLITSTLQAVVGQRLVRSICPNCKKEYEPDDDELEEFGVHDRSEIEDITFYRGEGCDECAYTGYRGRMGLYEYLAVNEEICDIILEQGTTDDIHACAIRNGMASLRQDGWVKICLGLTTFSEVATHTPKEEIEMASK